MDTPFHDRRDAGRFLAGKLKHLASNDPIVLALPRGGVPVAYEIATELNAPLEVFVVRKLGLPVHEELAIGAIASGSVCVLNSDVIRGLGVTRPQVESVNWDQDVRIGASAVELEGELKVP